MATLISAIFWLHFRTGKFVLMAQLKETPAVKRMPVYRAFRNYNSSNYTHTHTVILKQCSFLWLWP